MAFYTGAQFPAAFRGGAFVAFHGSWNRSIPTGYKVVYVHVQDGRPVSVSDFLTGFLPDLHGSPWARPVGLLVLRDGSLLVSDDTGGYVFRVHYVGR